MLTKAFLKNLMTKAQPLRPVVMISVKGLTENVHNEIDAALTAHELIKIKISAATKELREEMINAIAKEHNATIVQEIGHVLVLYRANKAKKVKKVNKTNKKKKS